MVSDKDGVDLYSIVKAQLDEYPRRCVEQIKGWKKKYAEILERGIKEQERSAEYASQIMQSITENIPYCFGGNVLNKCQCAYKISYKS